MGLDQIRHIVTLMFENRSFDNLLGELYPRNTPHFEGVGRTNIANMFRGAPFWPHHGTDMIQPFPNPNEEYRFVYRQMFDDFVSLSPPPNPPGIPPMSGFVQDYSTAPASQGKSPDPENIMKFFKPDDVPVISTLARSYAVCDHWFCSIPSQTNCNRSFVHAGTSSGFVDNNGFLNNTPTIFNLLSDAGKTWQIYYGNGLRFMSNAYATQKQLIPFQDTNFSPFSQFYTDIKTKETFPSYVFIEPNYIWMDTYPENDQHPEAAIMSNPQHPSNVLFGEKLLFDVFTALTQSKEWDSTLLIVLFDEHGGTFDHVAPPSAVPPDTMKDPSTDFPFNRLGIRVPAVVISPLIDEFTISNTVYDHTSVIRTVSNTFGLKKTLGKREENANDLSSVINRTTPRKDLPIIPVRPTPEVTPELVASFADLPLNDMQKTMIVMAMRQASTIAPTAAAAIVEPPEAIVTHADAWRVLGKLKVIEAAMRA